jgi:hypothetical protein
VVAGEEVMTTEGELIGLFLERPVPSGLTPIETALEIKAQGGLVYLEHPYDSFRRHLSESSIESLADLIDIVEVFNGRSEERDNRRAEDLCVILDAAPGAGSDAHSLREIGSGHVEMEDFEGAQDFLAKLRGAKIVKRRRKLLLMAAVPSAMRDVHQLRESARYVGAVFSLLLGLEFGALLIPSLTYLMENTDDSVRGRIFALLFMVVNGVTAIPVLLAAALSDFFGITRVIAVLGLLLAGTGLAIARYATRAFEAGAGPAPAR